MVRWLGYILTLFGIGSGGILLGLLILRKGSSDTWWTLAVVGIGCLFVGSAMLYFLGQYPFAPSP